LTSPAGSWISFAGDTITWCSTEQTRGRVTHFRRLGNTFRAEASTLLDGHGGWSGALAADGSALVWQSVTTPLTVDRRTDAGWSREIVSAVHGSVQSGNGTRPIGADGDLVVVSATDRLILLERRKEGWFSSELRPATPDVAARLANWPDVAVSGRTVLVGTRWDGATGGRAASST
jgi:hypothetical protein